MSTDRGLCGGFNVNLFRALARELEGLADGGGIEIDLSPDRQEGHRQFFRSRGGNVVATITDLGETPEVDDLIGGIQVMLDAFEDGKIDRLDDRLQRRVREHHDAGADVRQLVPAGGGGRRSRGQQHWDYIYEPDARETLDGCWRATSSRSCTRPWSRTSPASRRRR